jgi:hypothetical protein
MHALLYYYMALYFVLYILVDGTFVHPGRKM